MTRITPTVLTASTVDENKIRKLTADSPPGWWVAIAHDNSRVVAKGPDVDAVLGEIRAKGEDDALIVAIPCDVKVPVV